MNSLSALREINRYGEAAVRKVSFDAAAQLFSERLGNREPESGGALSAFHGKKAFKQAAGGKLMELVGPIAEGNVSVRRKGDGQISAAVFYGIVH